VNLCPSFVCLKCGECCLGRGGVYLDRLGVADAARHLGLGFKETELTFLERDSSGLYRVGAYPGPAGSCLFLKDGLCLIHPVKPPVCRAWPWFRALVTDSWAFREAQEACPGLARVNFDSFSSGYRKGLTPLPPRSYRAELLTRAGYQRAGG
jgi:Fe-S-cluster containining protein